MGTPTEIVYLIQWDPSLMARPMERTVMEAHGCKHNTTETERGGAPGLTGPVRLMSETPYFKRESRQVLRNSTVCFPLALIGIYIHIP